MNIKKQNRLNNSEIRYIIRTKNKKFLRWKLFNINIIDQFDWRNYNKFWVSISSKFSKNAVDRNFIRKMFFHVIREQDYVFNTTKSWYKKVYCALKKWLNKKYLLSWDIKKYIKEDLDKINY